MKEKNLTLQQLLKEREEHVIAIKTIDEIIAKYFKQNTEHLVDAYKPAQKSNRMRAAITFCQEILKSGQKIKTIMEFREILKKNDIILSRSGVALALQMPESNIYFDKVNKIWKLRNIDLV